MLKLALLVALVGTCLADVTSDDVKALLAWAKQHGADTNAISVQAIPGAGVGVVAAVDIQGGQRIMSIPKSLIMCGARPTFASEMRGLELDIESSKGFDDASLAISLLVEKARGERSFWAPYINILPSEAVNMHTLSENDVRKVFPGAAKKTGATTTPCTMSKTACLASGITTAGIAMRDSIIQSITRAVLVNSTYVPDFLPSKDEVTWALSMVKSRKYTGCNVWCGPEEDTCLIPIADSANHKTNGPQWSHVRGNDMGYLAPRPMVKGDEVRVKYEDLSMEASFSTYGFYGGDGVGLGSSAALSAEMANALADEENEGMFSVKKTVYDSMDCMKLADKVKAFPMREMFLDSVVLPCMRVLSLTLEQVQSGILKKATKEGGGAGGVEGMVVLFGSAVKRDNEILSLKALIAIFEAHAELANAWPAANEKLGKSESAAIQVLVAMRTAEAKYHHDTVASLKVRLEEASLQPADSEDL